MLVLSRKIDESIIIGDNIRITVIRINSNQVRIGIEAPPKVEIYREEIAPIKNPGASAARAKTQDVSPPPAADKAGSPSGGSQS